MTQEEKDLLLRDLCARLPYGVKCCVNNKIELSGYLVGIIGERIHLFSSGHASFDIDNIKPYLFLLSSMTEEQYKEYTDMGYSITERWWSMANYHQIEWLNKNHFDYRGLIPMGLAIDCTNLNIY